MHKTASIHEFECGRLRTILIITDLLIGAVVLSCFLGNIMAIRRLNMTITIMDCWTMNIKVISLLRPNNVVTN